MCSLSFTPFISNIEYATCSFYTKSKLTLPFFSSQRKEHISCLNVVVHNVLPLSVINRYKWLSYPEENTAFTQKKKHSKYQKYVFAIV